jgi:hypothetical protein
MAISFYKRVMRCFPLSTDFPKNYFSPDAFRESVSAALSASDEFVWIYSETPRWWSSEGRPVKLPEAYDQALRVARTQHAKGAAK